jgi:hypothetical protein
MGRAITLISSYSESIDECIKEEYEDTIIKHKMLFWNINDDGICPFDCNFKNKDIYFDDSKSKKAKSSKGYINKFGAKNFDTTFCLISETSINQ